MLLNKPIGVFDSGYGGLTVLEELRKSLPEYDFLYLGDNARTPYGSRSFDVVFNFTLEAVRFLFNEGCELIIIACNTASAKALRSIQQNILPIEFPNKRVLGVIRPTTEIIGNITKTNHIGIVATDGTVNSKSYEIEINKLYPQIKVFQRACPIWVPLIENALYETEGAEWFIQRDIELLLAQNKEIDTIILACTHYPLLIPILKKIVPKHIKIIGQGTIVAHSLKDYLVRHPEIDQICSKNGTVNYYTTENPDDFDRRTNVFSQDAIKSTKVKLA